MTIEQDPATLWSEIIALLRRTIWRVAGRRSGGAGDSASLLAGRLRGDAAAAGGVRPLDAGGLAAERLADLPPRGTTPHADGELTGPEGETGQTLSKAQGPIPPCADHSSRFGAHGTEALFLGLDGESSTPFGQDPCSSADADLGCDGALPMPPVTRDPAEATGGARESPIVTPSAHRQRSWATYVPPAADSDSPSPPRSFLAGDHRSVTAGPRLSTVRRGMALTTAPARSGTGWSSTVRSSCMRRR